MFINVTIAETGRSVLINPSQALYLRQGKRFCDIGFPGKSDLLVRESVDEIQQMLQELPGATSADAPAQSGEATSSQAGKPEQRAPKK